MAWAILPPPPFQLRRRPNSGGGGGGIISHKTPGRGAYSAVIVASSSSGGGGGGRERTEEKKPSFNPFGFVTDNPSSRGAIQLPENPAEDGNVGQMLYMADSGFHCLAPDWIGFGFSDKPQPGYGFSYTEEEYHVEFDKVLSVLNVKSPFVLVVQGFLVGSYGLTWALKNPSRVSKLVVLNSPLTSASPVPSLFRNLRLPLFGEFTCQNAVMAERFIEAGSAWSQPILLAWGTSDKYLPQSEAEKFQKGNSSLVKLKLIEGAGHMPQEDWPEKVVEALRVFI
ncbi:hypothetical protein QJS04_geneDACA001531 [Acorus gramineus]|uniref:AB hydrolase-1 domain-containing protein n=1 Tax=Acorus gramineus TaxID=55184 RepID=A0AAV9BKQ9_ACOGR|nr:hypothetical protein QJS04_geneDACA001531 [Acorus gramineus]